MAGAIRQERQETGAGQRGDGPSRAGQEEDADAVTGAILVTRDAAKPVRSCRPWDCLGAGPPGAGCGVSQFRRRANFMRRRSFLCLCFRIFFRRFFTTLAIQTPSVLPQAEAETFRRPGLTDGRATRDRNRHRKTQR